MEGRVFQPQAEEERVLAQHERDRAAAVTPELGVATDSRPRGVQTSHRPLPLPAVLARLESRPFVGRATPLRRLGALWEQVSLGKGGVVALAGEPGIGKSRLTARVAARAHAEGAVVLYGRADEESVSPYRHSSLAWRGVRAGLLGRFQDAERMARDSLRLAEHAQAPDAQAHFTAQLVALRREQGRLDELAPAIERLAGDAPADAVWRCVLPLAHLDAGARTQAQMAYAPPRHGRRRPAGGQTLRGPVDARRQPKTR